MDDLVPRVPSYRGPRDAHADAMTKRFLGYSVVRRKLTRDVRAYCVGLRGTAGVGSVAGWRLTHFTSTVYFATMREACAGNSVYVCHFDEAAVGGLQVFLGIVCEMGGGRFGIAFPMVLGWNCTPRRAGPACM